MAVKGSHGKPKNGHLMPSSAYEPNVATGMSKYLSGVNHYLDFRRGLERIGLVGST